MEVKDNGVYYYSEVPYHGLEAEVTLWGHFKAGDIVGAILLDGTLREFHITAEFIRDSAIDPWAFIAKRLQEEYEKSG